jgi:type I restriction enzyme S subunit
VKVEYIECPISSILKRTERFEANNALSEYNFAGTYSFARGIFVGERKQGSSFQLPRIQRIHEGDFVYSKIMAWEGAFGIVPKEAHNCVVSNAFVVYEIDETRVNRQYLSYYFKMPSVWKTIGAHSTGTNVRRRSLHPDQFEKNVLVLPSLEEQRRIVARIEELAAKIEEARGLRREAVEEVTNVFDKVMSKYFDFEDITTTVGNYAYVIGGYAFPSDSYTEDGTHQVVRIGNVRDGYLDLSRAPVKWDLQNDSKISRYELAKDDILISMTGTRNKRDYGYIAMVPKSVKLLLNQRVGKITPHNPDELNKFYLAYFLRSPFFRNRLFPNATGTANQANIGNKHIENIPFVYPSLIEQNRVVSILDNFAIQLDVLKRKQIDTERELNALLPSILDKAFKGEL